MNFELTKEQVEQYGTWVLAHKCDAYAGAIGGRISFVFTPTGLGQIQEARCMCGESINLTDFEDFG